MDPAVAALDFTKAGAVLADMVESFLAAGAIVPALPEGDDHDDVKDRGPAPVTCGMRLHSPVDTGTSSLQPGEHGAPVQFEEQGAGARLEPGEDPHPRPGSGPLSDDQSGGLQDPGQRRGDGTSGSDLFTRSFPPGAFEQGLASSAGVLRDHQ